MNITLLRIIFLLLVTNFVFGCSGGQDGSVSSPSANNIILFSGDGMGAEHRKAARWASAGENGKLRVTQFLLD